MRLSTFYAVFITILLVSSFASGRAVVDKRRIIELEEQLELMRGQHTLLILQLEERKKCHFTTAEIMSAMSRPMSTRARQIAEMTDEEYEREKQRLGID